MRSAQKNNRSRGRGNRKGGGGGGGGNVANRVYDSAGPEGKVRGTPQQVIDKYLSLARDAQTTGDRVMAENFLQHAEHYQRLLMQATAQQEQNRRDQAESGQDDDSDDRDGRDARDDRDDRDSRDNRESGRDGGRGGDRGGRDEGQHVPQTERRANQRRGDGDGEAAAADEIGGMTTIDSGRPGNEDLLVVAEDVTQSQPRRNGDGRRRRRKPEPAQDAGQAEADQPARAQQEN